MAGLPAFVASQRRHLLLHALSPWRRRDARLLLVGLSSLSPDMFWEAGFDVGALDPVPFVLARVREETGPKVDYHLGKVDYLPFDDKSFDHVVLAHSGLNGPALEEALRVASRGVMVVEWNRFSLMGRNLAFQSGEKAVWPWSLGILARRSCPDCRMSLTSILSLPRLFWPKERTSSSRSWRRRVNGWIWSVPVGALMVLRLDHWGGVMTPVGTVMETRPRAYSGLVADGASSSVHSDGQGGEPRA